MFAGDHTDEQVAEIVAEHQRQLRETLSRLDQSRAKQDKSIQQRLAERRQLKMTELHEQHSQEVIPVSLFLCCLLMSKRRKIGSFCVTGRSNIATFSKQNKSSAFFCQKEEVLALLFHRMLEGLDLSFTGGNSIGASLWLSYVTWTFNVGHHFVSRAPSEQLNNL